LLHQLFSATAVAQAAPAAQAPSAAMPESEQAVYRAYVMGPDNHIRFAHLRGEATSDEECD
jgi:hypothetical protein